MLHQGRTNDQDVATIAGPTCMSPEQLGQQPFANKSPSRYSSLKFFSSSTVLSAPETRKVQDLHKRWTGEYLTDLRTNRPARPNGMRPMPYRNGASTPTPGLELPDRTTSATGNRYEAARDNRVAIDRDMERPASSNSLLPSLKMDGISSSQQSRPNSRVRDFSGSSKNTNISPETPQELAGSVEGGRTIPYYERGQRWMEKQEALSLTAALAQMDVKEEQSIHAAAQDEATELVWKHRNPDALVISEEKKFAPYRYTEHLKKGSHIRSQSGRHDGVMITKGGWVNGQRSVSDGSTSNKSESSGSTSSRVSGTSRRAHHASNEDSEQRPRHSMDSDRSHITFPIPGKRLFNRRRSSGRTSRNISGEPSQSLFSNPEDKIYEEPEGIFDTKNKFQDEILRPAPLQVKSRNTSGTFQKTRELFIGSKATAPSYDKKVSSIEIHHNPPSQSRNPSYTRSPIPVPSSLATGANQPNNETNLKDGVESRGKDIRAATSMRFKDRSPKLPSPTVVSDRPGRPIVSFDRNYKPKVQRDQSPSGQPTSHDGLSKRLPWLRNKPSMPASTNSAPVVPTITVAKTPVIEINSQPHVPTIIFPDAPSISPSSVPTINFSDAPDISVSSVPTISEPISGRPLPIPSNKAHGLRAQRPPPRHSATTPVPSTNPHWSLASNRATAQCSACALPISGRSVSAANQRFHPACFTCFQCSELLECVAFYPEPDIFHEARLARIDARLKDLPISTEEAQHTEDDDGDDGIRFYCHLDFHEKFSPRCRSCKTPIEGEVIIACGGEWHAGHFFCAECGDPFDSTTPFVEKDGFAWCVGCHCGRFSGKCARCRKPVTEMVVKALGKEWHEACFKCKQCGDQFEDGRFFTRGESEDPVCVRCEEMRLKA